MKKVKSWIGVIPARGGSKSVPMKNIASVAGHPLIEYTYKSALASGVFDEVVIVTEDERIAEVSRSFGALVISRPAELAQDSSPTEPTLSHTLEHFRNEKETEFEYLALLQCTSPLRSLQDYKKMRDFFLENPEFDALMSLSKVEAHFHPMWVKEILPDKEVVSAWKADGGSELKILEKGEFYQRQRLKGDYYFKDGSIFATKVKSFMELGHRYGRKCGHILIPAERAVNIDSPAELDYVRYLFAENFKPDFRVD